MEKFTNTILKKILITIVLYSAYRLGFLFSFIPISDQDSNLITLFLGGRSLSLFALGFMPAISGYLLVEIVFLIIPRLRDIRNNGLAGRQFINRWGLGLSLVIAIQQSWSLVRTIEISGNTYGLSLMQDPTLLTSVSHSLFFIAGFALVLLIGSLISKYGIGNGFCIMIGSSVLEEVYRNVVHYIQYINTNNIRANYLGFLVLASLLYFIFNLLMKKDWSASLLNENPNSIIPIPYFLQGATILTFAASLYELPSTLQSFGVNIPKLPEYGTWTYSLILVALTVISSIFGHWIFSGGKRISSNLFIEDRAISLSLRPLVHSTITLSLLCLAFTMPLPFGNQMFIPNTISLFSAITLIAIAIDVCKQLRLILNKGDLVEICELDNVYLASHLQQILTSSQVNYTIQGFQYRRLYFFFQPFIKMKLLVPVSEREKAQNILNNLVIKNI